MKQRLLLTVFFCIGMQLLPGNFCSSARAESASGQEADKKKAEQLNRKIDADFESWEKMEIDSKILYYNIPPMSETQYLPDTYPEDGELGKPVRILAAGNEYEPGSFLLYTRKKYGKLTFELEDLKTEDGMVFPKSALDLKVVKVWYQNGNGWYSYFADDRLKLCPELLLNDEELIKVDTEKVSNYARLTEKDGSVSYRWLNPPRQMDNRIEDAPGYRLDESFCAMKPNFKDAETFQGATLVPDEFKQFFLTAHVSGQKPGLYCGNITLKTKRGKVVGKIPVKLRVLPFMLPKPKTYFDIEKDFLIFFCEYVSLEMIRQINGNDADLAEKQLLAIQKNFAAHNQVLPSFRENYSRLDISEAAGLDTSTFLTGHMRINTTPEMIYDARRKKDQHIRRFGKNDTYYLGWGDEYVRSVLIDIRPMVNIYKKEGFLFPINSRHGYSAGAYLADLFWPPVSPDSSSKEYTEKFNFLGGDGYFGWYANQHVGVENPAYIRRQYGLGAYCAGFSCHYNYAHHLNGYNDLRGNTYKAMNFVYGDGGGVIDTLAWEGFREGIDDIRYATLLQQLARGLIKSKNLDAHYTAKKALKLLADWEDDNYDLSTARLEMISFILQLQAYTEPQSKTGE